ncbi:MAG: TonB-dependent receptor, partial [Pseudohongiellaceae bacterium]
MGQGYYWTAYADNAFMPETLRQAMIAEGLESVRIYKIGQVNEPGYDNFYNNRNDINISQMWSASAGFDHMFDNGWSLRGTYQYGESKLTSEGENMLRIDRWYMAMDAVRDPDTGSIICNVQRYNPSAAEQAASVEGKIVATTMLPIYPDGTRTIPSPIVDDNAVRDCQPLNIFGLGNVSQEAADYVASNKKGIRDLDQDFAELLLTGQLHEGWGAGLISFAAGLTWRDEWFNQLTIPISMERSPSNAPEIGIRGMSPGITGGNRSMHLFSATSWATGSFDVWEWFGEVNVPVWESLSGSQRLDTNFAFRQSDYSSSGRIDSWKLGGEMQLHDDLRLRITKSRDVREPTFGEQFEARGGGANIEDPVTNTSYTITQLAGGNPGLRPEQADTLTAGVVYLPGWLPGFQASADWYEIDMSERVGSLGGQRIIDDCHAGDQSLCSLITRGATGTVERVLNVNLNVAAALTEGVDIEMRYSMEPNFFANELENLNFRLFASHMIESSVTTSTYRDQVGNLTNPEWNALATMGYDVGSYGIRLVGRYYDSTLFDDRWVEGINVDDNTRASNTVANLVLTYRGETSNGATWNANLNINNVFDREPPINPGQSQRSPAQQSINDNFDPYGRRYQLSVNYSF